MHPLTAESNSSKPCLVPWYWKRRESWYVAEACYWNDWDGTSRIWDIGDTKEVSNSRSRCFRSDGVVYLKVKIREREKSMSWRLNVGILKENNWGRANERHRNVCKRKIIMERFPQLSGGNALEAVMRAKLIAKTAAIKKSWRGKSMRREEEKLLKIEWQHKPTQDPSLASKNERN